MNAGGTVKFPLFFLVLIFPFLAQFDSTNLFSRNAAPQSAGVVASPVVHNGEAYSITLDPTQLSDGLHTSRAVARDVTVNESISVPVRMTVDNTAPSVSMSSPSNGLTVFGTTITVSANASDNFGMAGVQFKLD